MYSELSVLAAAVAGIWLYLLCGHGGFWRLREWLPAAAARTDWPPVVALVPARDEAATIARTVGDVLRQDYPGKLTLVVVDDQSSDGTAERARASAQRLGAGERLRPVAGSAPAPGWTGKLWALEQGLRALAEEAAPPRWLWLSDADIAHPPDTLRRLVAKGEGDDRDLVSLMVRLAVEGGWARLLIPPFVYFFRQLYPFAWCNDPARLTAAAAGGCVLVRRSALARAGGFGAISGRIIDDCALAGLIQRHGRAGGGRIWLGLADGSQSLRSYRRLRDIWEMVARSAYAQLRFSPWLLIGTVPAMGFVYLGPPVLVLAWPWHDEALAGALGLLAWGMMAASVVPLLRLYGLSRLRAPLLPLAALLFVVMTVDSARAHALGRGGLWKGRPQADPGTVAD